MCQAVVQKELEKLENEVRGLIMLEDSAHGTLCAIHSSVHTTGNFPQSNHHMLRLCSVPRCPNNSRIPIKERAIHDRRLPRSNSPSPKRQLLRHHSQSPSHRKPASPYQNHKNQGHPCTKACGSNVHLNIEKTFSCPGQMCVCVRQTPSMKSSLTSKSSMQIDSKIAHSIMCTDEIVTELKSEIERVKHQLYHIAVAKSKSEAQSPKSTSKVQSQTSNSKAEDDASQISKIKMENRRLKRELDIKRKLLDNAKKDVEKARDILNDYEIKVTILHQQAVKSSNAMKMSKERFCKCIKDKEEKIQSLRKENEALISSMQLNGSHVIQVIEENEKLKRAFEETCAKCCELNESNQDFCACIEDLKQKLDVTEKESLQYKNTVDNIEKKLDDMNCTCRKLTVKYRKQKETYESQLKAKEEAEKRMQEELSNLSTKLLDTENSKRVNSTEAEKLQERCCELESKISEYETLAEKCKCLEEECANHCETLMKNEMTFQKSQQEMQRLIHELTEVVHSNKKTLLEMSETNKAQEILIKTQSLALMSKEEQLRVIEKQSENFRIRTEQLEREVQEMRKSLSEPCSKNACLCISRELEKIKKELDQQKDNHSIAEKIIQDQSSTIVNLQNQVKEKVHEVTKARSDSKNLENQIGKINEKLKIKHRELNRQINEKENLAEKLKILEMQKQQLTTEIEDFEEMLQKFKETCGENDSQRDILKNLKNQIDNQKMEWDSQKEIMAKEKEKAVCAAKFATQKLLDTVADFQKQADAQKRVQLLLTKMLHEKDEQLKIVTSKICDINSLTNSMGYQDVDLPMKELFKQHAERYTSSDANTATSPSFYSSCTSSCKKSFDLPLQPLPNIAERICRASCHQSANHKTSGCNAQCARVQQLFEMLKNSDVPVQDVEEHRRDYCF